MYGKIKLRRHQKDALAALHAQKKTNRMICLMFCGTGKTFVFLAYIFDQFKAKVPSGKPLSFRVLISCPTRDLQLQIKEEVEYFWRQMSEPLPTLYDRIHECKDEFSITICTYQSFLNLDGQEFDLAIYDEAHRACAPCFKLSLDDERCLIHRRVFFTATMRRQIDADKNDYVCMSDEEQFGPVVFHYRYKKAVEDDVILKIEPRDIEQKCSEEDMYKFLKSIGFTYDPRVPEDFQTTYVTKAFGILWYLKHEVDRPTSILSFHTMVMNQDFFVKIIKHMASIMKVDVWVDHVHGQQSKLVRQAKIREFQKATYGILCSTRLLIEGVNMCSVSNLVFIDQKRSEIDIIQSFGRCVRKCMNQTLCIYLRVFEKNIHRATMADQILEKLEEGTFEYALCKNPEPPAERHKRIVREIEWIGQQIQVPQIFFDWFAIQMWVQPICFPVATASIAYADEQKHGYTIKIPEQEFFPHTCWKLFGCENYSDYFEVQFKVHNHLNKNLEQIIEEMNLVNELFLNALPHQKYKARWIPFWNRSQHLLTVRFPKTTTSWNHPNRVMVIWRHQKSRKRKTRMDISDLRRDCCYALLISWNEIWIQENDIYVVPIVREIVEFC